MERLRTMVWACRTAWQIDKAMLVAVFAFASVLSVLPAASLWFYKDAVAWISVFVAEGVGSFDDVLFDLLAYGVLLAFIGLSTRIDADFIGAIMNLRFTYGMQERLMEVINRFDVLDLLRRNVNEDFNYIVRSSGALGELLSGLCSIGAKAVTIATLCAVAWDASRPVFYITLLYVALSVTVGLRFSKGTRFVYTKFRKAEVKAMYLQNMPMEANIAKEIRVYGCVESVVESWNAAYSQRLSMDLERFKSTETRAFVLGASFYAFLAVVMVLSLTEVSSGSVLPADLLTVFTLSTNLFAAMGVLSRDLIKIDDSLFRLEQMHALLGDGEWERSVGVCGLSEGVLDVVEAREASTEDVRGVADAAETGMEVVGDSALGAIGPAPDSIANAPVPAVFSARNLSFSYDGVHQALDGVGFDIAEGEVVALVGSNGSGKSTLVKLLIGVFSPDEGDLRFRGRPYRECSHDYLSSQIGAFFQDFYLFHHTLSENISYGAHERIGHEDEVQEALGRGGAAHLVARLPRGAQSLVGKRIDKTGVEFSGGEKQLLATARTYMGDRRVLIFDEPASMLDPLAELGQFEAIRSCIGNSTGILISHRVGFARMADRIIMMEGGRIVEEGTHDELMARGGAYARFFREQAQWYEGEDGSRGCAHAACGTVQLDERAGGEVAV